MATARPPVSVAQKTGRPRRTARPLATQPRTSRARSRKPGPTRTAEPGPTPPGPQTHAQPAGNHTGARHRNRRTTNRTGRTTTRTRATAHPHEPATPEPANPAPAARRERPATGPRGATGATAARDGGVRRAPGGSAPRCAGGYAGHNVETRARGMNKPAPPGAGHNAGDAGARKIASAAPDGPARRIAARSQRSACAPGAHRPARTRAGSRGRKP